MYVVRYAEGQDVARIYLDDQALALQQAAADVAGGKRVLGVFDAPGVTETPTGEDPELGEKLHSAAEVKQAARDATARLQAAEAEVSEARAALGY